MQNIQAIPTEIKLFLLLIIIAVIFAIITSVISFFIIAPRKKWKFPIAMSSSVAFVILGAMGSIILIFTGLFIFHSSILITIAGSIAVLFFCLSVAVINYGKIRLFEHERHYNNESNAKDDVRFDNKWRY